jgi:cysteine desulfurase/selenocysteine lyase
MSHDSHIIYLDNAATTFPKPPEVLSQMLEMYASLGVSPGRGTYDLAAKAEEVVDRARAQIRDFFGGDDTEGVIFSYNATDALNTAILGLVEPGCHVVSSRLEHNSVLRPLHHLRGQGLITYDLAPFDPEGFINPRDVADRMRPETKLVVLTHVSNVLGTVQPIEEVAALCSQRDATLLLDVTQSAGVIPMNMKSLHVDALAFTGHKALMGPTGIGGLVLRRGLDVRPTRFGGTGTDSSSLRQTDTYPQRLEAGTINLLGVIGLSAGIRYISARGIENTYKNEMVLTERLRDGLADVDGVHIYCADNLDNHAAVLLCNIDGMNAQDFADILDADFNIATRSGLHCAPLVHADLGTAPTGGVRFSLGPFNVSDEIDAVVRAVNEIVTRRKSLQGHT